MTNSRDANQMLLMEQICLGLSTWFCSGMPGFNISQKVFFFLFVYFFFLHVALLRIGKFANFCHSSVQNFLS